jgi:Ser/Thr protein kinase RdoA (MazF antagonist)
MVRAQIGAWPTPPAAYGLIHGDVHAGNFHLHQGVVHLFDFDDCCYHWFAADIANAIYYAVWHQARYEAPGADPAGFAVRFTRALLDGYSTVAAPPSDLGRRLAPLIDYRDLLVYAYLRRRYGETPPSAALASLLAQRRHRFREQRPYVAVDWQDVV